MSKVIETIITGIIASYTTVKITETIIEEKGNKSLENIIVWLIGGLIIATSYMMIDNFLKVIFVFMVCVMLNKCIYKQNLEKSVTIGFIEYVNVLFSEILVVFILNGILKFIPGQDINELKNAILLNIVIMTTAYILAKVLKKQYRKIVEQIKDNSILIISILAILILLCISSLFYKMNIKNWNFNSDFLLNTILIIAMGIIGILVVLQRINYEKVNRQYKDLAKYSEMNAGLLEDYSELNHEHENQLIIIKGMFENNKKDELKQYLEQLISKKVKLRYKWIRELNNLSFQGLSSFISYKIFEMENKKIKVNLTISKKCKKYKLGKLTTIEKDQIYSVIGVFMDNAMQAAEESRKKEVIIDGYEQDGKVHLDIANTYKGEVDIKRIHEYGYTSKGAGHGTGLHIVEKITKKGGFLEKKTRIQNSYFIQTLIIKK